MAKGRKTGGRKIGTPNRLTYQIRLQLLDALSTTIENIPIDLEVLDPKERVESLIKLLPYLIPKVLPAHVYEADQKGLRPSEEVVEAFQAKNDVERVKRQIYSTRDQARTDLVDYIEMFYNSRRRHGFNNLLSPVEYEKRFTERLVSV